jgi:hypothetical protein
MLDYSAIAAEQPEKGVFAGQNGHKGLLLVTPGETL